jgi:periplasmic divalent cation tolerance protein
MSNPAPTLAYITCPDIEEARRIGRTLVLERLAACVNILPKMESFYWWEGKLENDQETVLIAKIRDESRAALLERVVELHPYDTPCVLFIPVTGGNPEYLDWLARESEAD